LLILPVPLRHKTPAASQQATAIRALEATKGLQGLIETLGSELEFEREHARAAAKGFATENASLRHQLFAAVSSRFTHRGALADLKHREVFVGNDAAIGQTAAGRKLTATSIELAALKSKLAASESMLAASESKLAASESKLAASESKLAASKNKTMRSAKIVKAAESIVKNNAGHDWEEHGRRMKALADAVRYAEQPVAAERATK
jgi:hypothetical protein